LLRRPGKFAVAKAQEDIHTAIEQKLTRALGDAGAKIHAGRSRNDQVQADLRLFIKDRLLVLMDLACDAAAAWEKFGRESGSVVLPGYTHLQKAMPTTVGHWAASHAEALLENLRALRFAYDDADASPLGSAAGYGVTLPLQRAYVAKLLGFSRVQRNTLRVQTSRPRVEAATVAALTLLARDLGSLAWDISLFTSAEFGFLSLDRSFTTGSSIMPQKKNPDVAELTRARAALFPGWLSQILAVGLLPSGYHRDYQITKGVLFQALDTAEQMLDIMRRLPASLQVNWDRCAASVTEDLLAAHQAISLVKSGVPFRTAYRRIAELSRGKNGKPRPVQTPELPGYPGAPGNPDWRAISADREKWKQWAEGSQRSLHAAWRKLL
jgi:argininosuccinate lyase